MTYLPLLQTSFPTARLCASRRSTRHLRLICLHILLRETRTNLLMHFEMSFLAIFSAVGYAVTLETLLKGVR